jgi:hypothetical protein
MLRFLARFFGLWLIAGAMVALVVDATRSIATGSIAITQLGPGWFAISPTTLVGFQQLVQQGLEPYIGAWLWDPLVTWLLLLPTWGVLGASGFLLTYLGRRSLRQAYAA